MGEAEGVLEEELELKLDDTLVVLVVFSIPAALEPVVDASIILERLVIS